MATSSLNRRVRDESAKPALRIVLYLRVSSKRQMDTDADIDPDGNSIDTQRKWCLDKAHQMGAVVIDEYVEPGNSAQTIEKRPVFRDMMHRIQADRDVDGVLIYMRSRAFRNYIDAGNTEVALSKLGVKLISAKEEFGDGPMAEAMKAITDVFNWLQVRMSGDDIKTKMANKARNGGTIGRAPVGYLNTTKLIDGRKINTVSIDPERAPHVVMAFELFATGQETYESLCTKLTQAGFRMPMTGRYRGGPISTTKIAILLRDRYYIGYITYKGIEYRGRHEPIISEELFDDVQNVLAKHTESHVRHRTHNHYLRGLLWCGRCKHRLVVTYVQGRHGGEYYYFYCRGRQKGLCDLPGIPVEVLEDAVAAYYADALTLPTDWLTELRTSVDEAVNANADMTDALRKQYAARLAKLEQKESYFLDLADEEGWPKDKLRTKIGGIRTEQREIHDTLNRSAGQLEHSRTIFHYAFDLLTEPHRAYQAGDEVVRGLLNKAFFTRLYIDGGKIINHQAEEPFDAILDGYRTYQLTRTTNKSAAATISHDAQTHHTAGLTLTLAGQGCDKPSRVVIFVIAGLTFAFGFGNGYAVGVALGVPSWIAPLVAPAVDLSVIALLASMQYLRANGVEGRLAGPRLLLLFSGTATLAMNVAHPILVGAYGQASFYAVAPLLLIGWSEVGPKLLAALHGTVSERSSSSSGPSPPVRDPKLSVPDELVAQAHQLDDEHRQATGRPISRDKLRAELKVSNAVAGEVLRQVRSSVRHVDFGD